MPSIKSAKGAQLSDSVKGFIWVCFPGLIDYYYKRKWHAKVPDSDIRFNVLPDDAQIRITVGRNTTSSALIKVHHYISQLKDFGSSITIGSYTTMGQNIKLFTTATNTYDTVSHVMVFIDPDNVAKHYKEPFGDIKIGNDCWIGDDVMIRGRCTIGDGAVIAPKAMVTKDVEPYSIVGGVPAKLIRYRFSKEIIDQLLEIKWWDWSDEKIEQNKELFFDAEKFVKVHGKNK